MSFNRFDYCKYCKAEMPKTKTKRYRATMCYDCQTDKKDGNHELLKIFDELREKNNNAEKENWGADNIKDNDDTPYKKRGHTEVWRRTTLDDI